MTERSVDVLIEIPKGSRSKYELDQKSGRLRLDRVLHSSVHYPADYGFILDTLARDGDPLDVVVVSEEDVAGDEQAARDAYQPMHLQAGHAQEDKQDRER